MKDQKSELQGGDVLTELREQTKWLRFLGLRALGPVLEQQLKSDKERLAYELSDGRSSEAVGAIVGVTGRSILNWWARWSAAGIAVDGGRNRVQRLASLSQLGIPVPVASSPAKTAAPVTPTNGEVSENAN